MKDAYYTEKESIYESDIVYIKYELNGYVTKSKMSEVYAGKK